MARPSERKHKLWFHVLPCQGTPRQRLFCFPYAGGSSAVFFHWPRKLPPGVEVWAVSLPGRGARFQERAFDRLGALLDALLPELLPETCAPYAFFGHSLGALVAFEAARRLRREGAAMPSRLVVSARPAPRLPPRRAPIHGLADAQFIEHLRRFGGTPDEAVGNPELMSLVLPAVRADFALVETHSFVPEPPLAVPIHAFGGLEDERVPREDLEAWSQETSAGFFLELFPGGHFYLDAEQDRLLTRLGEILAPR